jgi:UDP-glucose 4-epimerase
MTPLADARVLVTGGAGFVGSALANRLVESGAQVTVFDDLSGGRAASVPVGATLISGSVADPDTVRELVAEHSLILHLAARGIVASTKNPREDFETNVAGTLNVLLAARECEIERIVCASSASIYGNPRTVPINEDDVHMPLSPYAVSKLSGEHYCLAFYESYGVPVAIVRYSNVYGPGQHPDNPYSGVVTKFLAAALEQRPLPVHGDGQQTRDFTFIDDAVDATLVAATHPRAEGEVFNVGTGIETSVLELARALERVLGVEVEIEHIDRRDVDNIRRRVMNIEKVRRMLRWSPQVALETGLRRTAESFGFGSYARKPKSPGFPGPRALG